MKSLEAEFLASGDLFSLHGPVEETVRIMSELERLEQFRNASCVLAYMSMPGEVRTPDYLARWRAEGKRVVLPKVTGETLELREYDPAALVPGYRGIMEPSESAALAEPSEIGLAVVPGMAFSFQKGPDGVERFYRLGRGFYRLGRGGGFYDRLLPMLDCPLVGVCYPFRFVDFLPLDEWDMPLDLVVR